MSLKQSEKKGTLMNDSTNAELKELVKIAEAENESLNDYGDIPPDSYEIFKKLIDKMKEELIR
jgi:hypothetical protein